MNKHLIFVCFLALAFISCSGGGPLLENDPDIVSVGPVGLSEKKILAEIDGQNLLISFPFVNVGEGSVKVVANITVRAISGEFSQSDEVSLAIPSGGGKVEAVVKAPEGAGDAAVRAIHVIEYSFSTPFGELSGSRSLFAAVGYPELIVMAPPQIEAGAETVVKAFGRNSVSGKPIVGREIKITISTGEEDQVFTGVTDGFGAVSVKVRIDEPGQFDMVAMIEPAGDAGAVLACGVDVVRTRRVLVTTDKPMYQPGQQILIRALALKKPHLTPDAGLESVIEVFDGKGNKVFRKAQSTGEYGVVDAKFQLATEVNMGTYRVRVTTGDTVTEKAVTVGRYSLPKFKVTVGLEKPWYLVGQTIKGTVSSAYFFGKPVAGGAVRITGSAFDVEFSDFATVNGTTDGEGIFGFQMKLPDYLVGQDLEQGRALVRLSVEVTDAAGQKVTKESALTVAEGPLSCALIPESGTAVAGMTNRFYVYTEAPDGSPVEASVTVTVEGTDPVKVTTDKDGMGSFEMPVPANGLAGSYVASLASGDKVSNTFEFKPGVSGGSLLVRTDHAIYRVGDTATVTMSSADAKDRVYLDVLRSGQVVHESAMDLVDSKATVQIDLDQEMSGDLVFAAYYMAADGTIIRDEKTVFVDNADSLNIAVKPDKKTYLPGEEASVNLKVTNVHGTPVASALGIQIVDEAVYALTEMKPGLLETYFALEKAITEPKFEVHGVSFDVAGIVTEIPPVDDEAAGERRDKEATAAFAAMGDSGLTNADSSKEKAIAAATSALSPLFMDYADALIEELRLSFQDKSDAGEAEVMRVITTELKKTDFFGNPWKFEAIDTYQIRMTTNGPDEVSGTADDWSTTFQTYDVLWGRWEDDWTGGGVQDCAVASDMGVPEEPTNGEEGAPRLRSYFPETLLWSPLVITDESGSADIKFNMADSITQWRMTTLANSMTGLLGSSADGLTVFMDFFVDIDLPRMMTRGDQVEFPIAIYNYLETAQKVDLQITAGDWAELGSGSTVSVNVEPGQVKGVNVSLKALSVGWHSVTVSATGSKGASDALQRLVEVIPDGTEVRESVSGRLDGPVEKTYSFPAEAIEGTQGILVKVYPGIMSQVVEGLDSMLQMPSGCFEQTTSTLWPDALVLKYVKDSGTITPAIELKAREFVNLGYQRLLTFECTGGGFTWFGDPEPANVILTAMGVLEFADIASVMDVDETLIPRTAGWLKQMMNGDGSWHEDQGSEFATVAYDDLMTTCLVTWALAEAGDAPSAAVSYIASHLNSETSTYALALCSAALTVAEPASSATAGALDDLTGRVEEDGKLAWWSSGVAESQYNYGEEAVGTGNTEVTSLAVLALLKAAREPVIAAMAIDWLASKKDSFGNWGTTHATILSLRAFVASLSSAGSTATGTINVNINGTDLEPVAVTAENADVFFQFELKDNVVPDDANLVKVSFSGEGTLMYQIVQSWWVPGGTVPDPGADGPLTISVEYDKHDLKVDSVVGVRATVRNVSEATLSMIMVDIGLPPGFDLLADGLNAAVESGLIVKYETTARQVLVYIEEMAAAKELQLSWELKARYPLDVKCPDSGAYLYYDESGTRTADQCGKLVVTE